MYYWRVHILYNSCTRQFVYISQKYTLNKYTLEKYTLEKKITPILVHVNAVQETTCTILNTKSHRLGRRATSGFSIPFFLVAKPPSSLGGPFSYQMISLVFNVDERYLHYIGKILWYVSHILVSNEINMKHCLDPR